MYLIPQPHKLAYADGHYVLDYDKKIVIDSSCSAEAYEYACLLQDELQKSTGYALAVTRGDSAKKAVTLETASDMQEQEYRLEVSECGIRITGGGRGLLYGVQTLRQIVRQEGLCIPYMRIHDYPDIENRGLYYDVTRGRVPTLSYLKGLADKIAFYKMNQLQLYIEHTFLFEGFSEVWRDDTPLSAQDILELDRYCRRLNIELVPSLSCFGHLYKVLRTKSFGELCELPDAGEMPFGFVDRMEHHTLDVSNEKSLAFVEGMIEAFLPLFTSEHFNIGADETFDLGKGRGRRLAEQKGTQRMYIGFVKELCEFLIKKGKKPMFWGDIICGSPELIGELPKETVCLNWGYDKFQSDEAVRKLAAAGAVQYLCPGVSGWDQFANRLDTAYGNIRRMCSYAVQYGASGVLTTDWGDCGHINHPDFAIPGIIYGAAFSWNESIPDFEQINRQISLLEYGDRSERFVSVAAQIPDNWVFQWRDAVNFMEKRGGAFSAEELSGTKAALKNLEDISARLRELLKEMPKEQGGLVHAYLVAVRGMELIGKLGAALSAKQLHAETEICVDAWELAAQLEEWFMYYKEVWRKVSRESELYRIQNVIFWYADMLRG